jgi:hypothetical protein
VSGVHSTRGCLARYVPPSGFRTLLTACSSRHRPALFHAGGAPRVSPFGAFPFRRSRALVGPALPACRWPRPGYGSCSLRKSVAIHTGVSPCSSSMLPWVSSPPGVSLFRRWLPSSGDPPLAGFAASWPRPSRSLPLRVSLAESPACLFRKPPPLRSSSRPGSPPDVAVERASSHGVSAPVRVLNESSYPAIGSGIPPRPSLYGGPRGLPRSRLRRSAIRFRRYPLLGFRAPPESRRWAAGVVSDDRHSLEVCSLPALEDVGSPLGSGLPRPIRSASRVSHPLDGLLLPKPSGPISCRWRS